MDVSDNSEPKRLRWGSTRTPSTFSRRQYEMRVSWHCTKVCDSCRMLANNEGMASPLLGVAAVNSLLFTAYGVSRRIVSPYPELSIAQTALAGSMAGAANAILASPVSLFGTLLTLRLKCSRFACRGSMAGRGTRSCLKWSRTCGAITASDGE